MAIASAQDYCLAQTPPSNLAVFYSLTEQNYFASLAYSLFMILYVCIFMYLCVFMYVLYVLYLSIYLSMYTNSSENYDKQSL